MGSSTGNMLVDDKQVLNDIFSKCDMLIAVHCEDEETVRKNSAQMKSEYGEDLPYVFIPLFEVKKLVTNLHQWL